MFSRPRTFVSIAIAAIAFCTASAELPKDSPFGQGGTNGAAAESDPLEFAGVSTIGKKTMINLYDRQAKHGFWVQEGQKSEGVTVVKYDAAHDQVTVRRDGAEKTLSLRAASAVVSGPATPASIVPAIPGPAVPATGPTAPATSIATSPATPATDPAANTPQARAKQEEEARMLVSDLLEIGIAQRKAYEDAQRRAASGQTAQPNAATPAAPPAQANASGAAPAGQPTGTGTASPAPTGG